MTHQQIADYCLQKPGAYLDYPFGEDAPVIKVKPPSQDRNRIFAQLFHLRGEPKVTLNCKADAGELYRNVYPGAVVRGWHCPPVQQPYFNTISLDGAVPDDELFHMMDASYEAAISKFPKYIQKELQNLGEAMQ